LPARSAPKLGGLRRALERERRALAECLHDRVEVSRAGLALMTRRAVAVLLERELLVLQPDVRAHALLRVAAGEPEHRRVQRVEPGQRHELELVTEAGQLLLEARDRAVVQMRAPVERGR